jgi:predicted nucleic acid-binding protein
MTAFVVDASVTMSWLLSDGKPADRAYAQAVLEALKAPATRADVPVTWGLEVANVIARAESQGLLSEAQSEAFLEMLSSTPIRADESTFPKALTDTLHLARRYGLSSYDASYLELALRTGSPLATLDSDLAKAARKAGVKRFTTP